MGETRSVFQTYYLDRFGHFVLSSILVTLSNPIFVNICHFLTYCYLDVYHPEANLKITFKNICPIAEYKILKSKTNISYLIP